MSTTFTKKIFTAEIFFKDVAFIVWNFPKHIFTPKDKRISPKFTEKIMNITTAINGCTVCTWFHAKKALETGISEDELQNMMKLQFQADASEYELIALLYAQHNAETNRNPGLEITEKLFDFYGEVTANQIIYSTRIIFFGNLYGNTWDAVISRMKGNPAPNSNLLFEIFYFFLNFVIMIPLTLVMEQDKRKQQSI